MTTHPNRSKKAPKPGANPKPKQIVTARLDANLTQREAAALIYCSERGWQQWEGAQRTMHPALWELWLLKVAQRAAVTS